MNECVLDWCEAPADAGLWCRKHWDESFARDVAIVRQNYGGLPAGAATEIVTMRRQLDLVRDTHGLGPFCRCGHMHTVHSHGGCHGLSVNGSDQYGSTYAPCKCLQFNDQERRA